jgi:D-amino-acid N-acetyltransferase
MLASVESIRWLSTVLIRSSASVLLPTPPSNSCDQELMPSTTTIRRLEQSDKSEWRELFLAYHDYYEIIPNEDVISTTFNRFFDEREPMYASLAIGEDGKPIGFVHWVYHRSTLAINNYLYLHDLFVKENIRSKGVGRSLIEHVYEDADRTGAARVYWQTKVNICCHFLIDYD